MKEIEVQEEVFEDPFDLWVDEHFSNSSVDLKILKEAYLDAFKQGQQAASAASK